MRRYKNLRGFVAVCLLALVAAASARPEPNSFIERLCNSTGSLVAHAKSDKRVMDRYTRHFAMTPDEVVSYLSGLTLTTTKTEALYTVYAAPDTTPLRSKVLKVKKGTKVFVDASGEVVLLWYCGNPVTRGPKKPLSGADLEAEPKGDLAEELRLVPTQSSSAMINNSVEVTSEPNTPDVPVVPVQESDIPIASVARVPGWLAIIPALGIIRGNGNDNPPVPEPATMVVLGTAVTFMLRRRAKKNN